MRIAEFIRTNLEAILDAWERFAKETASGKTLNTGELRDHAIGILHTIAADLEQTQTPFEQRQKSLGHMPRSALRTEAEMHGSARVSSGFSVNDAMAEFRALRASVLRLWIEANPDAACNEDVNRFNEAIDQALSESLARFSGQKDHLTRMFDTILSASPNLNYIFHPNGDLIYANKAFAARYSIDLGRTASLNLFALSCIGEQEMRQLVAKVIRTKAPDQGEISCTSATTVATYEHLLIPVLDEAGNVEAIAGTGRDITAHKEAEERSARSANYDALTGLPNRNLFLDRLKHEVKRTERNDLKLALMFIDLDGFKEVNDNLGHASGDELLRQAAQRIHACVRDVDTVARLGGDEFTVIFADVNKTSRVEILAQLIVDELVKPFSLFGTEAQISASIGIALYPQDAQEPEDLLKCADQAMYVAKSAGRNRFSFFTAEMRDAAWKRLKTIEELRVALQGRQFLVHYQPIIDLTTGHIVKAEAQLRWQHPRVGLMRPADFIGLAEETGLIGDIGDWVMKEALVQAERWSNILGAPFQVWVHKSAAEFMLKSRQTWANDNAGREHILVEVNEDVLLKESPLVQEKVDQLSKAGIELAVDNFGTGYASMTNLTKFDVNYLKIASSFIHAVTSQTERRVFAESAVVMAHKLGLKVIAEGVETAGQKDWLKTVGCDLAQGYFFSEPLPATLFEHLLH